MNENYYIGTYMCFYASNPPSYPKQLCGECSYFEKCFDFLFNKKNMETKEVKIEVPEGYEIDESKSSFKKIVFKKKEKSLPKSWKEFARLQECHTFHLGCEIINYNVFSSVFVPDEYATAIAALNKLIRLRDYYNDGWKPDWENDSDKFILSFFENNINACCVKHTQAVLAFKTEQLRDEFYNNFKNLIKEAKEVL